MSPRHLHYLWQRRSIRKTVLLLLGTVLLLTAGRVCARRLHDRLVTVRAEQALVEQIPEMQHRLKMLQIARETLPVPVNEDGTISKRFLQGTYIQNGAPVALIGETIYAPGDPMGEFIVREISLDALRLSHPESGESIVLHFRDDEPVPATGPAAGTP